MIKCPTDWRWLVFNNDEERQRFCKSHAVHVSLMYPLVAEMRERGYSLKRGNALPVCHIDDGGACIVSAPIAKISDLGFRLEFWCDELPGYRLRLERAEERSFKGGLRYYKLHGAFRVITLTPEQRETLLAAMKREEPDAAKRHEDFMKMWRRASKERADAQAGQD